MPDFDRGAQRIRHGRKLSKRRAFTASGIFDVIQQQRSTAVKLETKVSRRPRRLEEEFDAAVATHHALVGVVNAADVAILDAKQDVHSVEVMKKSRLRDRAVLGAERVEMTHVERVRMGPAVSRPLIEWSGRNSGPLHYVRRFVLHDFRARSRSPRASRRGDVGSVA